MAVGRAATCNELPQGVDYLAWPENAPPPAPPAAWRGHRATLVHLAWDTSRTPRFAVHAQQVQRLAELLETWGSDALERVVGLGSAEEFGARSGTLHADDAPQGPLSAYGWGKRAAGELLAHWSARHGASGVWLCPTIVYGPGQAGNMVIPYALRQALRGERALFSDGRQLRDLVHVDDVAAATVAAAIGSAATAQAGFQRAMLGTGQATAVRDVILHIARCFQAEDRFELGAIPRRAGEPELQVADTTAAERLLGWRARIDWRRGVATLCAAASAAAAPLAPNVSFCPPTAPRLV